MKSGVYVRAKKNGSWETVDILDLTEQSFRVFTMQMLARTGVVTAIASEINAFELEAKPDSEPEEPTTE
jgi:hypothetical protein